MSAVRYMRVSRFALFDSSLIFMSEWDEQNVYWQFKVDNGIKVSFKPATSKFGIGV